MFRLSMLLLIALTYCYAPSLANEEWETHTFKEFYCTIDFFGKVKKMDDNNPADTTFTTIASAQVESLEHSNLQYTALLMKGTKDIPVDSINVETLINSFKEHSNLENITKRDVVQNDLHGKRVDFDLIDSNMHMTIELYVYKNVLFQMLVTSTISNKENKDKEKFFDSLTIIAK